MTRPNKNRQLNVDPRNIYAWQTGTNYKIAITPGLVREIGNNKTYSPGVASQLAFKSFNSGPYVTATNYNTVTAFLSTITLAYNRQLRTVPSGHAAYNIINTDPAIGVVGKVYGTSTFLTFDGTHTVSLKINQLTFPDGDYYIESESGVFTDNFNFPNVNEKVLSTFNPTTTATFHQTSITNMVDRVYKGNQDNLIFADSTPQILDDDIDPSTVYTLEFTVAHPDGLNNQDMYWNSSLDSFQVSSDPYQPYKFSITTSKSVLNAALKDIILQPHGSYTSNDDLVYDFALFKRGVQLVGKTLKLLGSPFTLDAHLVLASPATTSRRWWGDIPLTATFNTTTDVSGIGLINFNELAPDLTTILTTASTSTIVNNVAISPHTNLGSSGTYTLQAAWPGRLSRTIAPYYYGTYSNTLTFVAYDRADYPGTITLQNAQPVYQLDTGTYLQITASVNTATSGTFSLVEIVGTQTSVVSTGSFNNTTTTSIFFNPDNVGTFATSNHIFQLLWDGQTYIPNKLYPYFNTASNTVTQAVRYASMTAVSNVSTNTVRLPNTFNISVDQSISDGIRAGTVSFYNNEELLGTTTTQGATASLTVDPYVLSTGTHKIHAVWNNTTPVVKSNTVTSTILAVGTSTLTATNAITWYAHEFNLTSSTSVTLPFTLSTPYPVHQPTGFFNLYDGATIISSRNVNNGNGLYNLSWDPNLFNEIDVGTRNLTLQYSGDPWYYSTTTSIALTAKERRSMSITASSNTASYVRPANVTLTVTADGYNTYLAGKTVDFYANNNFIGTGTLFGSTATASITFDSTLVNTGTNVFKAIYNLDWAYTTATSNSVSASIQKGTIPISVTLDQSSYLRPSPVNVRVTTPTAFNTSENIVIYDNGSVLTTIPYNGTSGTYTFTATSWSLGSHAVYANFGGDINYNGYSSNTVNTTVDKDTIPIRITANTSSYVRPAPVTYTISSDRPYNVTENIVIYDNSGLYATIPFSGTVTSFTTSSIYVNTGSHTVYAAFAGDINYYNTSSNSISTNVTKQTVTAVMTVTSTSTNYKTPVTINLTTPGTSSTGLVTITDVYTTTVYQIRPITIVPNGTRTAQNGHQVLHYSLTGIDTFGYVGLFGSSGAGTISSVERYKLLLNGNEYSTGTVYQPWSLNSGVEEMGYLDVPAGLPAGIQSDWTGTNNVWTLVPVQNTSVSYPTVPKYLPTVVTQDYGLLYSGYLSTATSSLSTRVILNVNGESHHTITANIAEDIICFPATVSVNNTSTSRYSTGTTLTVTQGSRFDFLTTGTVNMSYADDSPFTLHVGSPELARAPLPNSTWDPCPNKSIRLKIWLREIPYTSDAHNYPIFNISGAFKSDLHSDTTYSNTGTAGLVTTIGGGIKPFVDKYGNQGMANNILSLPEDGIGMLEDGTYSHYQQYGLTCVTDNSISGQFSNDIPGVHYYQNFYFEISYAGGGQYTPAIVSGHFDGNGNMYID